MSDTKAVSATLQLKLKADSGYTAEESHRISADQWGDVIRVATGTLSSAERDQLLAELEKALDSLEYVEQHLPGLAGYGVRQERIASGRAAIAAVKGGAA